MTDQPARPWIDPRIGDSCTTASGQRRTVAQITYCGPSGPAHPDRRPGDWVDSMVYEVGGLYRRCAGTRWMDWCRVAVRDGGRYEAVPRE